jgi:hypothetical protein
MQKLNSILIAASLLGLASCSQVEEITPAAEQRMVVHAVDIRVEFDDQHQNVVSLDINEDGQTDFVFFAKAIAGPGWGNLAMVGLMAGQEGNQALARSLAPEHLCQMSLPMSPGKTLTASEDISESAIWADDALLYGRTLMNNGCEEYSKYIDYGQNRYIGIRFEANNQMVYGWVKLVAVDLTNGHYPESADIWKITEFAYSEEGSTTLRIPA